ncbi:MAG TPA: transposase, partial [Acidimicrobiales bacterium]|nr:transposase [Acidimicrobiales bacterium]
MKEAYWALFNDTGTEPGDGAIAVVKGRAERFVATYTKRFPSAVDCLMADFASLTTYLRFPAGHHARIRHSNFIERTFGETRRRVKVI